MTSEELVKGEVRCLRATSYQSQITALYPIPTLTLPFVKTGDMVYRCSETWFTG